MTDATTPAAAPVRRCPACGAVRPPTARWCLQCYAAFDPPQPALGPQEPVRPRAGATPPAADPAAGTDGRTGDGDDEDEDAGPPADRTELDDRAEQMLAQLSQETTDQPGGRLGGLTGSKGSKAGLAIGGAVGLTLLLLAAMAVLGALL